MSDEGGEPPASSSGDRRDTQGKRCEHCGEAIDTSDWYPVTKERDSDGSLRLRPFCSDGCREAWLDGQSE